MFVLSFSRRAALALVLALSMTSVHAETIDGSRIVIIDGDTVALPGGERIRLLDIDAPESFRSAREEANQALARTAGGEIVTKSFTPRKARFSDASVAGWVAGSDVALHHGVGGSAAPKLIGGGS